MKIDVKKVARLSNLNLSAEEEKEFEQQLNDIINYVEKLNSVDTSSIDATSQVTGLKNVTRSDDGVSDSLTQKETLSGTEKSHEGLFVVDKLVETNE